LYGALCGFGRYVDGRGWTNTIFRWLERRHWPGGRLHYATSYRAGPVRRTVSTDVSLTVSFRTAVTSKVNFAEKRLG
jgi:hypothetical protein